MNEEKTEHKKLWTILGVSAVILVLLLHFIIHLDDIFTYRYLRICDPACAADYLLILFVPSLLCGTLAVWAIIRRKEIMTWVSVILLTAVLILSFLPLLGRYLYTPAFCSSTDNIKNYRKVDNSWINMKTEYPDEVPEDAQETKYFYWYMNIAAEHWFCIASWKLSDPVFEAEVERLRESGFDISEDNSIYASEDSVYGKTEVLIDWDNRRIAYFSARLMGEDSLPASLEEFYSTEYSIETILEHSKS
ncbi:MAG: hypothetical protein IK149_07260 [Oscillospiraceae bacterium]|nr:hypothetical protein [Oscillospiraceae bacterium]